ncbi:hypothetical protein GCM10010174_12510 [Kutzneria viridogrisea]
MALAPVAGSGAAPEWICLVSNDQPEASADMRVLLVRGEVCVKRACGGARSGDRERQLDRISWKRDTPCW